MITYKIYFLLLFCLLVFSCCSSKYSDEQLPQGSVLFNIKGPESSIKGTTRQDRANIPDYIVGVVLKVENMEYDVKDVIEQYNYNQIEGDTNVIVLSNITFGTNKITVKGVCNNPPLNFYYKSIPKCNDYNLNKRAKQYGDVLKIIQPIYASYVIEKPVIKNISADINSNIVDINMVTQNHRVAVIIENSEDSNYILKAFIFGEDGTELLKSDDYIQNDDRHAMIINNTAASEDEIYTVEIKYYTKHSEVEMLNKTITRQISASKASNITKLYHFSKDNLLESNIDALFSWNSMKEIISGEYLD